MHVRGLLIGGVVAAAVAGCGGGGSESVQTGGSSDATIANWISALDDESFDGACGLLTSTAKDSLARGSSGCPAALRDLARQYPDLSAGSTLSTTASVKPNGVTSLSASNGRTLNVRTALEGDRWFITSLEQ